MIFNEKWPFYKMMKTTFFGNFMILQNIRLLQFCVAPIWKWNVTHLCTLKFTEETLMFTQCAHYAGITIFQKNNENYTFYKITIFNQNRKYGKAGVPLFCWKRYVSYSKYMQCTLMYIEIHGGKHYVYIFYRIL